MNIFKLIEKMYFLREVSIYTLSSIINSAIPFLLMPVLTRYLTPSDYGIIAIAQSIIGFMIPFIGFELQGAIAKQYYAKGDVNISQYIMSCLQVLFFSSLLVFSICLTNANNIEKLLGFPKIYLWLIVLIAIFQTIGYYGLSFLQISKKSKKYSVIQITNTIINAIVSITLVVVLSMNWQGRLIAQFVAAGFFMYSGIIIFKKENVLKYINKIKWEYILDALRFGIPLLPHALSGFFIMFIDRLFISNIISNNAVGLYVAGSQIGLVINILTGAVNQAYVPWLFEKLKKPTLEIKKMIVKYTYLYMIGLLVIASIFSFLAPVFINIFLGSQFIGSKEYVWGSLFSGAFTGMYYMVVNYIFYSGKTIILSCTTLGMGLLHAVMTYSLINIMGTIGAVYSSVITSAVTFLVVWYLSNKVYKMPWV